MIDKNKQYRTRNGREVRIYATDGGGLYPVHGAILEGGVWLHETWRRDGVYNADVNELSSLIEVKPRIQRDAWVNVYAKAFGSFSATKAQADEARSEGCLACVKITIDCEEGEGL